MLNRVLRLTYRDSGTAPAGIRGWQGGGCKSSLWSRWDAVKTTPVIYLIVACKCFKVEGVRLT